MHYFFHNRPTNPSQTTNLSVEFYKPKYKNGKRVRNRVGRNVVVNNRSHATPFDITYYSYPFNKLDTPDIEPIYQQILIYVKGGEYKDPFIGTDKEAKTDTVSANFIIKDPRNDIPQNVSGDRVAVPATSANYGADYVSESKTIRLNESDLRRIVGECIRKVLSESEHHYNVRKIVRWDCIPSNGYEFQEIPGKGTCVGIMMYVDNTSKKEIPPTYCLFRRGNNGKYFYATIIASPEGGPKATKFSIVPLRELPVEIYKDRCNLSLQV